MSYLLDGPGPFAPITEQEAYLKMLLAMQEKDPRDFILDSEIKQYRQSIAARKGAHVPLAPPIDVETFMQDVLQDVLKNA